MQFAKGHGTGNDFVVLPDLDGALTMTPDLVRALCNRRRGIGGDGVLRVVRTAKVPEVQELSVDAEWFMDYHNADGTMAEMCGNGIRVYARWLQEQSLLAEGEVRVATRDGMKSVIVDGPGDITVDMGPPQLLGATRRVQANGHAWEGTEVWMGNPHVVVQVEDLTQAGALLTRPVVEPAMETNVEFVAIDARDRLRMRVHERGSGETQSCGTGACAAAVAAATWEGRSSADATVTVPGGDLQVRWTADTVLLTGPAVIVGGGELDPRWLARWFASPG